MCENHRTSVVPPTATRTLPESSHALPVGGYGCMTVVTVGSDCYHVCRTHRGRQGWGVHTHDGQLIVSGWPTKVRAVGFIQSRGDSR